MELHASRVVQPFSRHSTLTKILTHHLKQPGPVPDSNESAALIFKQCPGELTRAYPRGALKEMHRRLRLADVDDIRAFLAQPVAADIVHNIKLLRARFEPTADARAA